MTTSPPRRHARGPDQAGFTLIELLVAMVISTLVLLATFKTLDTFVGENARQDRQTTSDEQVRASMDRAVRDLRGAGVLLRAQPTDLVYTVAESGGSRVERLCIENGVLYSTTTTTTSTPAAPPSTTACSTGTRLSLLDATSTTAFTYDGTPGSSSPGTVRNVGLTFGLSSPVGSRPVTSTLRASASVRRASTGVAVPRGTVTVACTKDGPLLNLNAGAGLSYAQGPVSVGYATNLGASIPGSLVSPPTGVANAVPTVVGTASALLPSGTTGLTATFTDVYGATIQTLKTPIAC